MPALEYRSQIPRDVFTPPARPHRGIAEIPSAEGRGTQTITIMGADEGYVYVLGEHVRRGVLERIGATPWEKGLTEDSKVDGQFRFPRSIARDIIMQPSS